MASHTNVINSWSLDSTTANTFSEFSAMRQSDTQLQIYISVVGLVTVYLTLDMRRIIDPINPTLIGIIPATAWSFDPVTDTSLQCAQLLLELTAPIGAIIKIINNNIKKRLYF
jgi:hypothetical protein